MSTVASPTSTVDYSRKWLVMIAVVAGVILATIDGSIVNVAMPTLVESLDTSFSVIQWVSLAYLLTIATLTLGMGRLGDVIGKRTLYAIGFGVFTVASALCGLAPNVEWLIAFRVVQALGSVLVLALGS
ncbi:MAG TPA: MFS transporter, partial [Acidimicrobiia bacterium]